jgi:DNA-binding NtrC family response regulator
VVVGPTRTSADARRVVAEERPELVLMDVILDGEMASDLVGWLHDRGLRVVLMSGLATAPKSIGQHTVFLQKPFSADELSTAMRTTILAKDQRVPN